MKRTVYELIKANAEVLRELTSAGVAIEDYKNIELYEDFIRLRAEGLKTAYVVDYCCRQYQLSERSVWRVVRRFRSQIPGD